MYNWKWYLKDIVHDKNVKVFSCFSCGGGSSMGYKRAGFEVLGNCEIDPRMNTGKSVGERKGVPRGTEKADA